MKWLVVGLLLSSGVWGCKCREETLCAELGSAGHPMFAGTVLWVAEVTPGKDEAWVDYRKVRLRVRETFGGAEAGSEVEVLTGRGHGDCGVRLIAGEEYLVDARRGGDGVLRTSICSHTAAMRYAGAPLAVLRARMAGRSVPSLAGLVGMVERTEGGAKPGRTWTPLGMAQVRVKSAAGVRTAKADGDGVFLFYDLPEGRYEFDPPGWQRPFQLTGKGCVKKNLTVERRESRTGKAGRQK